MKTNIQKLMADIDTFSDSEMLAAALDEIVEGERDTLPSAKSYYIKESACQIRGLWELVLRLSQHQDVSEYQHPMLSKPISHLCLSPKITDSLLLNGEFQFIGEIVDAPRIEIELLEDIGKKSLEKIEEALDVYGLRMKEKA